MTDLTAITALRDIRYAPILSEVPSDAAERKAIGALIRKAREDAGYKEQQDFAAALGMRQSRVSDWERGRFAPNRTNIARIASATRKPIEYFHPLAKPDPGSSDKEPANAGTQWTAREDQTRILQLEARVRELEADISARDILLEEISTITGRAKTRRTTGSASRHPPKHRRGH